MARLKITARTIASMGRGIVKSCLVPQRGLCGSSALVPSIGPWWPPTSLRIPPNCHSRRFRSVVVAWADDGGRSCVLPECAQCPHEWCPRSPTCWCATGRTAHCPQVVSQSVPGDPTRENTGLGLARVPVVPFRERGLRTDCVAIIPVLDRVHAVYLARAPGAAERGNILLCASFGC
jgi:hypothetical protein